MNDVETIKKMEMISTNRNVEALEKELLTLPQVQCSVTHSYGPGVYLREVTLPKGSIVIGHHQNFEHMNMVLKGKVTFFSEQGPIEVKAPMNLVTPPGRKIAYIHEDTIWVNVYPNPTNETDVEKLEGHFLTKSGTFLDDLKQKESIKLLSSSVDKSDFTEFLNEFSLNEQDVRKTSENKSDMSALPFGNYKIKTGKSSIEGVGLLATSDIEPGEVIAPARIRGKRTIAGRYTNHSLFANSKMVRSNEGDIDLVATRKITGCHGGQDGEEITINYREYFKLTLEIGQGELICQQ